jgi:hypothetical protein
MGSILFNYAIWLTKHAAYIAATMTEPTDKGAKEMHKSLKQAAGVFKFVQENYLNKLIKTEKNLLHPFSDLTDAIITTYINQCKAEAQESKLVILYFHTLT